MKSIAKLFCLTDNRLFAKFLLLLIIILMLLLWKANCPGSLLISLSKANGQPLPDNAQQSRTVGQAN